MIAHHSSFSVFLIISFIKLSVVIASATLGVFVPYLFEYMLPSSIQTLILSVRYHYPAMHPFFVKESYTASTVPHLIESTIMFSELYLSFLSLVLNSSSSISFMKIILMTLFLYILPKNPTLHIDASAIHIYFYSISVYQKYNISLS